MKERLVFWIRFFRISIIIKLILFYIALPLLAWLVSEFARHNIVSLEGYYIEPLYFWVPISACFETAICAYEYEFGKISAIIHRDKFKYVVLFVFLILNMIIIYPLSFIYFPENGIDEIMKLEIITFFMCGFSIMLVNFSENLNFSMAVIMGYIFISNNKWVLEKLRESVDVYTLTSIRMGSNKDDRQMEFFLIGCIFWIVGLLKMRRKKVVA